MATITEFKGRAGAEGLPSGLDQLRSLGRQEARDLLARLGNDLNGKTGVVRLLHTSKADKEMKFQTAGGFKQMFLNGGKLERSGDVIRALLAKASEGEAQLADFDAYLSRRGRSGVEAERVREEIQKLGVSMPTATVGSTPDEALARLGMNFTRGELLGEGNFGKVYAFKHGSQSYVVKEPLKKNPELWRLQSQENANQPPANTNKALIVPRHHSTTSEESSEDGDEPSGRILKAHQYSMIDEEVSGPAAKAKALKLARSGPAVAEWTKNYVPQLIRPSVYVVREENTGSGEARYHAVQGGGHVKSWFSSQEASSKFYVQRMVMPRAAGKPPLVFQAGANAPSQVNVKAADLPPMARAGLEALKNLSAHGFIHGDLKPDNMFWDSKNQSLSIIDTDGMKKISERADPSKPQPLPEMGSAQYLHPMHGPKAQLGAGRDLFAFGMSLLECSVFARGDEDASNRLAEFQEWKKTRGAYVGTTTVSKKNMDDQIMKLGNQGNPLEDFAMRAMKEAVAYELDRKNSGQTGPDRWKPDIESHPLNVLSLHPLIAGI